MVDENLSDGPTVNISVSSEGEANAGTIPPYNNGQSELDGQNLEQNPSTDATENVAIAAIEAERDIAVAEIAGDVERERIGLEQVRIETVHEHNEELGECRREIAELREKVQSLTDLLTPPPVSEEATEELLEIVPETNLTQPSIAVPTLETTTEHFEESAEESPAEEIPSRVRRFIAI